MDPDLSRRVGRILGKASPPPSPAERSTILRSLQIAEEWDDLPEEVKNILQRLRRTRSPYIPPR